LALEETEGIGDESIQVELAENQRAGPSVVDQAAQSSGNSLGADDALLDFGALFGIGGYAELKFEVRENSEQRVVDFVSCSEGEAGEGGVFFVLGELGLELELFFVEFLLFVKAAEEFLLGQVALFSALFREFVCLFELEDESSLFVVEDDPECGGGEG
jgi:hypothetical protein